MITLEQYFGPWFDHPDATAERKDNALQLILAMDGLWDEMKNAGIEFLINPNTDSYVSGKQYGGFRPQGCPEGSPHSAHKEGLACDVYDPRGEIDAWLQQDFEDASRLGNPSLCALARHGIYIEQPASTKGWSHWTIRAPGSGSRIFWP